MIYGNDRLVFSVVLLLLLQLKEISSFSWPGLGVVLRTRGDAESASPSRLCCGGGALGTAAS